MSNEKPAKGIEFWMPLLYRAWKKLSSENKQATNQGPGRAYPSEAELALIARGVQRLSRGFTGHRNLTGTKYLDDPQLLGAYLLYYWPISYLQTTSILQDMQTRGVSMPQRILDCGSGPGPVACALADAGSAGTSGGKKSAWIKCLDHSQPALNILGSLKTLRDAAEGSVFPLTVETKLWNAETGLSKEKEPVEVVSFGHSLNECWKNRQDAVKKRFALVKEALDHVGDSGYVLIVEPALRETTEALLELRDLLVSDGQSILAPCSFVGPCPARADGQICHAQIRGDLPKTVQKLAMLAGLDKSSVAMSCLVVAKKPLPATAAQAHTEDVGPGWYRVVSESMVNKAGRTRMNICGREGRFSLSVKMSESAGSSAQRVFAALQRGDCIQVENPEQREGGWGIAADTVLKRV